MQTKVLIKRISFKFIGFVGADLEALIKEAATIAVKRIVEKLDNKS